jgi:hypothetical protein
MATSAVETTTAPIPDVPGGAGKSIGTVRGVKLECDTPSGAAWVEKYLHPPGERRSEYRSIPTMNTTPSNDLEYRCEDEIGFTSISAGTTKVVLFLPPSIYRLRFGFDITDIGGVIPNQIYNKPNTNISLSTLPLEVEAYRMAYRSSTFYQDSTGFTNAGMSYAAQFRPNVTVFTETPLGAPFGGLDYDRSQPMEKFHARFKNHKGYKEMLLANAKQEQGKGKLGSESLGNSLQVISLGVIPTSGGDVLMKSPKSTSLPTRDGMFMVHQFSEPDQRYVSFSRQYPRTPMPSHDSGTVIYSCYEYSDGVAWYLDSFPSTDSGTNSPDFPWYDMTWGVIMFDLTGAQSGPSPIIAPIVHKCIIGLEVQPVFGSTLRALARAPPIYDFEALRMASITRQAMPDGLPASANDLGSVLGAVMKFAPMVIDTLKSVFGSREGKLTSEVKQNIARNVYSRPLEQTVASMQRLAITPRRTTLRRPPPGARWSMLARNVNAGLSAVPATAQSQSSPLPMNVGGGAQGAKPRRRNRRVRANAPQ